MAATVYKENDTINLYYYFVTFINFKTTTQDEFLYNIKSLTKFYM